MKRDRVSRLVELVVVLGSSLAPLFFLASSIDADEFKKAGAGATLAAISATVFASYRKWKGDEQR